VAGIMDPRKSSMLARISDACGEGGQRIIVKMILRIIKNR
jgi:hypothetical protein